MIVFLAVQIFFDQCREIFDGNGIGSGRFLAKIACRCLTHVIHVYQHIHKIVLNEVKITARFFPWRVEGCFKR